MDTAPHPNRVLAFCASLAFLSFITGRTVRDERDNRTNLYLVALADPGVGKDHPRKCNAKLAKACMLGSCMADEFGSGEGLEDSLFIRPAMLYQIDEFDTLINSLHLAKDQKGENSINRLLRLYSSANSVYFMRKLALKREDRNDPNRIRQMEEGRSINNPHLVIFGTAIPPFFYQSLTPRMLNNGLLARCLVVHAGERGPGHKAKNESIPAPIINAVSVIKSYAGGGNLDALNPQPRIIQTTEDAEAKLCQLNDYYDQIYKRFEKRHETTAMTIWARAFEKVCKLALIHAISMNPEQPVIQPECVEWADKFVDFLTRQMLYLVSTYSYENEFDEKCKKVMRYLRECGGRCPHSALLKRSHESKEFFRKIMETLVDNGSVIVEIMGKNNHTTQIYRIRTD